VRERVGDAGALIVQPLTGIDQSRLDLDETLPGTRSATATSPHGPGRQQGVAAGALCFLADALIIACPSFLIDRWWRFHVIDGRSAGTFHIGSHG
jgi:hypothetical protein